MLARMVLISSPCDAPALASQSAGIIGVSHRAGWSGHSLIFEGGNGFLRVVFWCMAVFVLDQKEGLKFFSLKYLVLASSIFVPINK